MLMLNGAPSLSPDVIVLDIGMPKECLNAGQRLQAGAAEVKLILPHMKLDPDIAAEAFSAGRLWLRC